MSKLAVHWQPKHLPVTDGRSFPVRNVWCVGRNFSEHVREMGGNPAVAVPVFFSKPSTALETAARIAFPPLTVELHHEAELVVLLQGGGRELTLETAQQAIFGYAVGVDLTRRDVQARAKQAGQPWALSKGFDQSGPIGLIRPATEWQPSAEDEIALEVDGTLRQQARLGQMSLGVVELIMALSRQITLGAGDVLFCGTPAGVGPLQVGESVTARIQGLPELRFELVAGR